MISVQCSAFLGPQLLYVKYHSPVEYWWRASVSVSGLLKENVGSAVSVAGLLCCITLNVPFPLVKQPSLMDVGYVFEF